MDVTLPGVTPMNHDALSASRERQNQPPRGSTLADPYSPDASDGQQGMGDISNLNVTLSFVTMVLFFLFVIYGLYYYWRHRNEPSLRERMRQAARLDPPKKTRTQKYIRKHIILKRVFLEDTVSQGGDVESGRVSVPQRNETKNALRSDLWISKPEKGDNDAEQNDEEEIICQICLCEYEHGEQICWSYNKECSHHFHANCGVAWLAKHSTCPTCRAAYLADPEDEKQRDATSMAQEDEEEPALETSVSDGGE